MIIRPAPDRIHLITQPDHAKLARTIMEQCAPLASRPRRDVILHAIGEHDNGWAEEDGSPAVHRTTGRIVDFLTRAHAGLSVPAARPDAHDRELALCSPTSSGSSATALSSRASSLAI